MKKPIVVTCELRHSETEAGKYKNIYSAQKYILLKTPSKESPNLKYIWFYIFKNTTIND